MLGLGSGLTSVAVYSSGISSPLDIGGLELWLRHNTGVSADLDTSGETVDHSTVEENMADGDKIDGWLDQSGAGRHAEQDTEADAPLWVAASNSVNYASGKYMNIRSGSQITEAEDSDFTFVWRGTISGTGTSMTMFGNSSTDFWRVNSGAKVIRTKIGGATAVSFTESTALETNELYTFTLTRSSGIIEVRVDGGSSTVLTDHQWGGTTGEDADAFSVTNIGAAADDSNGWRGIVKHAMYYAGAITESERNQLQEWLKNND
jgi:hypothetical protein